MLGLPTLAIGAAKSNRSILTNAFNPASLGIAVAAFAGAEARFVDPRTMAELPIGRVEPDKDGRWTVPTPPSLEDWLLIVQRDADGA